MQTFVPKVAIGQDDNLVTFESPGALVPDGDGGFLEQWEPLAPPTWYVDLRPATARDAERMTAGTILTHVSWIVHGRFHPQLTTQCRMTDHQGHVYQITSVVDKQGLRGREMDVVADRLETP